jgi:hypothetical protein
MDEAAEHITTPDQASAAIRCTLLPRQGNTQPKAAVRSLLVVVADVAAQESQHPAPAQHQRPVQTLHADALHPSLGVGVRSRRPDRRADDLCALGVEYLVEARVNLASWSRSRNLTDNCRSFRSIVAFLACWK